MLSQLNAYYDAYAKELMELYKKASPMAGVWGMGNHPRDDRCNEVFYYNVEKWVKEFLASKPSQEGVEAVVDWLLKLAQIHRDDNTFWFSFAIQTHAKELIPLMSQARALELKAWYDDAYSVQERLPAQQEIYKALGKKAGKTGGKTFGFFRRK